MRGRIGNPRYALLVALILVAGGPVRAIDAYQSSISSCAIGSSGIGDPYYPTMGNGGYDVLHYDLDLNLDGRWGEIAAATVAITAQASVNLCAFNLDFEGLIIDAISVNDAAAEYTRMAKS